MMKKKWKEPLYAVAFVVTAALLLSITAAALRPVRVDYGAMWGPYLAEPKNSLDYLYMGSSYAYCDVNPGVIYDKTGLTGYVMAGPEQTLAISYHYLQEALKTQSPQVVVIEASALHFKQYQNYTQVNVGYMPPSRHKLEAIFDASEPALRTGLLWDLYFYHSRWKDVTPSEALRALLPVGVDRMKGFTAAEGTFEKIADGPFQGDGCDETLYRENFRELGKMLDLCTARGITPVVVFHPTYSQLPPEEYRRVGEDVAAACPQARYYNWSGDFAPSGLDPLRHFYDPGHLNREGAALFSAWLGGFFQGELSVTPRGQTPQNAAQWQETADQWR